MFHSFVNSPRKFTTPKFLFPILFWQKPPENGPLTGHLNPVDGLMTLDGVVWG